MTRLRSQSYVTTDGQSASLFWWQIPISGPRPDFYYCQTVAGLLMWGALSDERTGLSFTIAAGPRQRSLSRVPVPWDSWPYFTVSDSRRLPQPGGPRPRIYIPQEQVGPGTGFPFHRLRLAGLRWRYSNPPPHGVWTIIPRYIVPARTAQKTSLPLLRVLSLPEKRVHRVFSSNGCCTVACLHNCYLAICTNVTIHLVP
jgi:hypothetical protein